jgi:hypothetical protein
MMKALEDLTDNDHARDARAWFLSSDKNVGSFIWVCLHFGIEPTAVRHMLWRSGFRSKEQTVSTPA